MRDASQQICREASPVCRHEVAGGDCAHGDDVGVGAFVAHYADALQWGEHGEGLAQFAVDAGAADLVDHDGVGGAYGRQALFIDGSDDADGETGTGERMTPDPLFGQAERQADLAHFVLEEHTQRLNQVQVHLFRQATDVVVGLDAGRGSSSVVAGTLDDVGVECSLCQECDGGALFPAPGTRRGHQYILFRCFFEDANKFLADDFAFLFRVDYACQAC